MRGAPARRWLAGVVLAASSVALVPLATPTVAAAMPEVGQCTAVPELSRTSRGESVQCLQYLLVLLGLPVQITGSYDTATENAVRWYQAQHPPLRADGVAGEQTLRSMGIFAEFVLPTAPGNASPNRVETFNAAPACLADAEIERFERGPSVTCLQQRLVTLGLYSGAVTGTFDPPSQLALKAFQQANPPLNVDGIAGPRTLAALGIWSGISVRNGTIPTPAPGVGGVAGAPAVVTGAGPFPAPVQDLPHFAVNASGIPFYDQGRQACTPTDAAIIAAEFGRDGADPATQQWAVYIASREGGCRADAVNINPLTRDDSHCTFQINVLSGTFEPHGELGRRGWTSDLVKTSIQACADAASDLWVFCGRGPWTPPYRCAPPWKGASSNLPVAANLPSTTTTSTTTTSTTTTSTTPVGATVVPPMFDPLAPAPPIDVATTTTTMAIPEPQSD